MNVRLNLTSILPMLLVATQTNESWSFTLREPATGINNPGTIPKPPSTQLFVSIPLSSMHLAHAEAQATVLRIFNDPQVRVVDVRSPVEITTRLPAEHWINAPGTPYYNADLACQAHELLGTSDRTIPILVYCSSGTRSEAAVDVLHKLGYTNVHNGGGIGHLSSFLPIETVIGSNASTLQP